jgi:RNA polymerase sigma-70 factor (ECF subfamily)
LSEESRKQVVQEIARCQSRLRALVRCLFVRPGDAEDILQEINAVLWEKAADFRPGTDFWAWASQIARFKALNQVRKYSRERRVFQEPILEQMAEIAAGRLEKLDRRREALEHCLHELPPPQRQLIDLRYADGHNVESIAESIGRPAASVRQALYRIRGALQVCIEGRLAPGGEAS